MQFTTQKRRQAPNVIIVSLIDVLIVVLIFLMVTTTFKLQPSVKITLPESKHAKAGATQNVRVVSISRNGPLYLDKDPVTLAKLQEKLVEAVRDNPNISLAIDADTNAPWGEVMNVRDAAQTANIKVVSAYVKSSQSP
ncbi:MAG TPA: biopolymer transporter ExbD [Verrucomicrobiae bacterium]|jgi:biopolymer transport protein ExbD|nr:biopolymer transporter ExbD [Verrucomicrobiae bacterium]